MKFVFDVVNPIESSQGFWFVLLGVFRVRRSYHFLPFLDGVFGFVSQKKNQAITTSHVDLSFPKPLFLLILIQKVLNFLLCRLSLQHCLDNKPLRLDFLKNLLDFVDIGASLGLYYGKCVGNVLLLGVVELVYFDFFVGHF